jgi:hypothetical protein
VEFDQETIDKMLAYENSGFSLDASVKIPSWDREGLERLIRYCAKPPFASENLKWNGPWLTYRLPKRTHTGKISIQLEPAEFIDRISKFILHRRHYFGVFAANSPLRKTVLANASQRVECSISPNLQKAVKKTRKIAFTWAKLIERIYQIDPLTCICGNKLKITALITNPVEIQRFLKRIGLSYEVPEFDPPYDFNQLDICQLFPGTEDGFYQDEVYKTGPDPPLANCEGSVDPPHWEDNADSPHWEEASYTEY